MAWKNLKQRSLADSMIVTDEAVKELDEDGLIKATDYSSGSSHDSNHFTHLFSGNESAAYADIAYQS